MAKEGVNLVGADGHSRNTIETLASGAGLSLTGHLLGRVLALVAQVVLARLLEPARFGLYALGFTSVKVGGLISQLGLDKGVVRFATEHLGQDPRGVKSSIRQSLQIAFLGGMAIGAFVFALAPWLAEIVFEEARLAPVLRGFSPAIALYATLRVGVAATTVTQDMRYKVKAQDLIQPGLELLIIAGVYLFSWGLSGAIAALVLSTLSAVLVVIVDLVRLYPEVSDRRVPALGLRRELMGFSVPVALGAVLQIGLNSVDRYLIGSFRPIAEVGIYQTAAQVSVLFTIILSSFNAIFMPMIAELVAAGDRESLESLYRVTTKWGLYASLPFFAVIVFNSGDILGFVFGPEYRQGALPLLILAVGQVINLATGAVGLLLIMNDRATLWNKIAASMLLLNITLGFLLIPELGIVGAAIAAATAVSGQFLVGLAFVRRELNIWPYDFRYLKGLTACVSAALAVWSASVLPVPSVFLGLVISVSLALAVFIAVFLILGPDDEDRQLFDAVKSRVMALTATG